MKAWLQTTRLAAGIAFATCLVARPSLAELSCNPVGVDAQTQLKTQNDPFFQGALKQWEVVTKSRYVEGDCVDTNISGYEGFPVKKCSYRNAGEGDKKRPLSAMVVVLNPSSRQLASWSIHACRSGGATDKEMPGCLGSLLNYVRTQNGAQFPVVGSVVESRCDFSGESCNGPVNSPARTPVNTLFRNGVSISYQTLAHWTPTQIDDETYRKMLDTDTSDRDISSWFKFSRVSGAERTDWIAWRKSKGMALAPEGVDPKDFHLDKSGWGEVSRIVHQLACKSESNELFDALVFTRGWAK